MSDALTVVLALCAGGGIGVSVIGGIREWLAFKRERKAKIEDDNHDKVLVETLEALNEIKAQLNDIKAQGDRNTEANKFLLYDRLRHLGQCYIKEGSIDIDDRRIYNAMHDCYHNEGGNGDLDHLTNGVNSLPLKI